MITPPSSSMFTWVTRPLSSLHRPVSSKPNAAAIQSAARPTSSYENIGTTRCAATEAHVNAIEAPADAATSIREHRLVLALLLRVGIGGRGETKVSRYTLFLTLLSAHSCELLSCRVEDRRMEIYIRFGRRRRHERHVVERRQEDAAIQGIEMDQPVQLGVATGRGLAPVPRSLGPEEILDPAAETRDVPRQAVPLDRTGDTRFEARAEGDHALERVVGENLAERGTHRSKRQDVRGNRAADAADVGALVPRQQRLEPVRDLAREPVGGGGNAGGDRLPYRQQVRIEPVGSGVATRSGAERMRLVDDQQRPRLACRRSKSAVEPGLGMDDSNVLQRRLRQHARDVAKAELALERLDVVPLHDPRCLLERDRWADVALTRDHRRTVERSERLVDGAVVAPVEDEDLRPARELAREPDREPIRVRRGERELPARQPEAAGQLFAYPERILTREHERDAACGLVCHRPHGRCRGMPGHRGRVTEAEVRILETVHVAKTGAARLGGEHREASRPAYHPRHRHSREQRALGPRGELARARVLTFEPVELS